MKIAVKPLLLFLFVSFVDVFLIRAAEITVHRTIRWLPVKKFSYPDKRSILNFEGAAFDPDAPSLPNFYETIPVNVSASSATATILNPAFTDATDEEILVLKDYFPAGRTISATADVSCQKKSPLVLVKVFPLRFNTSRGKYEKLISFDIRIETNENPGAMKRVAGFAQSSILKSGTWYKIGVTRDGIYKLTYTALKQMGMDSVVSPQNIRLFGNGGGMVPTLNSDPRSDDLKENSIVVKDENNNGKFDTTDYVLFYGQSPNRWKYDLTDHQYHHIQHYYSDTTYYFITTNLGPGKRVSDFNYSGTPNVSVTSFDNYDYHEVDKINFVKSGTQWCGESFDIQTTQQFKFSFPNIVTTAPVYIKCYVLARSTIQSYFVVSSNGLAVLTLYVPPVNYGNFWAEYALPTSSPTQNLFYSSTPDINIGVTYSKPLSSSSGWLDYIELNARQYLTMSSSQFLFRDMTSVGPNNIAGYTLSVNSALTQVWDVTDPGNISRMNSPIVNNTMNFTVPADVLHEFAAFNNTGFLTPSPKGKVENQNLHAAPQSDMIIVAHPNFLSQAKRLADFHKTKDNLSVVIVTPEEIYNEFSSGAQDISAIRDFTRMMYERSGSVATLPKYLLLFGDGSYDNKHRLEGNTDFICTCQSLNSLSPTDSYVTDDYFVQLDPNEGNADTGGADLPDVAVGRLPVKTPGEAKSVVDKIIHYSSPGTTTDGICSSGGSGSAFGDWRNVVCFVADDGDQNTHLNQANSIASYVDDTYKPYDVDKIYFDSYHMESTPGGQRYPDVNNAIDHRVQRGALIVNYTGHGGESGWAHERVLDMNMINSWTNINTLPLFFTATCEFSRFDDPGFTSAGETVLLSPQGGGIALMTTTRLVYSDPNFQLNNNFFHIVFNFSPGSTTPAIGEIFRQTKVASGPLTNNRNFTLLGDPALRLDYPFYQVGTNSINEHPVLQTAYLADNGTDPQKREGKTLAAPDTIRALSKVTIKGELRDKSGQKLSDFNGILYPTVYDKADSVSTLANKTDESYVEKYKFRKNIIYHGKASVKNGDYSFTFVVPKDISYKYGNGRVSYYAENGNTDGNGFFENFIIGGIDPNAAKDVKGPGVKLYMNDPKFSSGGMTDENPKLYAVVTDENGINTVGNGIGHDITAILDNDNSHVIALNDYYESDLDSYQSGKVVYPFYNLKEGRHTILFKVWDVYNNSSETSTEFIVSPSGDFALSHVLNYPNPFTTHTQFFYEHNRCCTPMHAQVQIFTVTGKLVKTLEASMINEGYHSDPIDWDGRDDFGNKIGRGVYVYRLRVRTVDGKYADKMEKLVILN